MELKDTDDQLKEKVSRLLKEYKREKYTIWGCVDHIQSKILTIVNPKVPRWTTKWGIIKTLIFYMLGVLPFTTFEFDSLQLPYNTIDYYNMKMKEEKGSVMMWIQLMVIGFGAFVAWPMLYHLKARGVVTMFWVCNDEGDIIDAYDIGASCVLSDRPTMLSETLGKINKKTL